MTDIESFNNLSLNSIQKEIKLNFIIKDVEYGCYILFISTDCAILWLGKASKSSTIAFGCHIENSAVNYSRVLEPLNFNSTFLSTYTTKISKLLNGKQVIFFIIKNKNLVLNCL